MMTTGLTQARGLTKTISPAQHAVLDYGVAATFFAFGFFIYVLIFRGLGPLVSLFTASSLNSFIAGLMYSIAGFYAIVNLIRLMKLTSFACDRQPLAKAFNQEVRSAELPVGLFGTHWFMTIE